MKKGFQILCSSILVALSLGVCFIAKATNNVKEVKVDAEASDPVLTLAEKVKGDKKEKPTLPSGLDKWDGTSSEAYAGGNGTEASPYQIANGKQLMQLKKDLAASNTTVLYYELTNDIDLDNHDIMIGAYTDAGTFPGVFDGNNHTIYNYLYNGGTTGNNHALFGQVTGTVKNLTLVGSMTGRDRMAGMIRNLKGGKLYNLNSFVDITATLSAKAQGYVGGLCGSSNADNSVMENCNNYGNIIFKGIGTAADGGLSVGGVISYAGFGSKEISVKNCNNYGNIQASLCRGVGGVAGFYLTGSFDNCHNYGLIKTTGDCRYVGGFMGVVGTTSSILSINNCFNYGHVDLRVGTLTYKDHFIGYEWPTATITITNSEHGATKAWDESVTTSAFEGSGTEEDPYLIQSGSDLKYLADQVAASNHFAGKYFKQTENIYLNGKSIMIGTYSTAASTVDANYFKNSFAGHYDGNNKCVAGYFYSSASGNNYSLFGHINKGSVKNLVTTGFISARDRVSGAIRAINNATVKNVTSYVDIYCATSLTANVGYVGGVISATSGNASNDVVNNVTNYGNITFEGTAAPTGNDSQGIGGVVGYLVDKAAAKGSLSNLVNFGDVYASNQRIGTGGV